MAKKCETCKKYNTCKDRYVIVVKYRQETKKEVNPKKCKKFEGADE